MDAVVVELTEKAEAGAASRDELRRAGPQAAVPRRESRRVQVDRDEVLHAVRAPDDDVAAPLVDARDDGTDRLELGPR